MPVWLHYSHILAWTAWKTHRDHPSSQAFLLMFVNNTVIRLKTHHTIWASAWVSFYSIMWGRWDYTCPTICNGEYWKRCIQPFCFWSYHSRCFLKAVHSLEKNNIKNHQCLSSVLMAQAVPSETPALCWYGNRLPDITSRAMLQHLVLAIYDCWFKISRGLYSLFHLPLWTFMVNLFFLLMKPSGYFLSYCIPLWSTPGISATSMLVGIRS